jgi:hypothetical protein
MAHCLTKCPLREGCIDLAQVPQVCNEVGSSKVRLMLVGER